MNQHARKLIESGDAAAVERYFRERPELIDEVLDNVGAGQTWLHFAARESTPEVVRCLVHLGVPINTVDYRGGCALEAVLDKGDVETARWLLEQGADPGISPWPMYAAITNGYLELVRQFVELGARTDYHMGYPSMTLAELAAKEGQPEIAAYLRSLPRRREPGEWDGEAAVLDYFRTATGSTPEDIRYGVSFYDSMAVPVWVVEPAGSWGSKILFTTGMSDRPLIIPEGDGIYQYVELMMVIPGSWKIDPEHAKNEVSWIWVWLRKLALLMHQYGSCVRPGGTHIMVSEEADPLDPSTKFCAFLLLPNYGEYDGVFLPNGRVITLANVVPLYREELELATQSGVEQLLARFGARGIEATLQPDRANAALEPEPPRKPGWLGRLFGSS